MTKTFQPALQSFHSGNLKPFFSPAFFSLYESAEISLPHQSANPFLCHQLIFFFFWPIIQIALKKAPSENEEEEKRR